ncbi:MAG TPA: TonB-dependent receptor [Myxococcota bacterium]|nr:TonB-dependent receptor [Myxococcota bacterium]HQP95562.1 TonB-dependent receptor [Myxococcota bacterium]
MSTGIFRFIPPFPALVCMLLITSASAQEQPVTIDVPGIDVFGDPVSDDPLARESPGTTTVTDQAALESPAGPSAAVKTAPAVMVRDNGGPGQAVSISIRGADPRSTLLALDGIPLNSVFMGGADLNSLGLLPLDALDVSRGGLGAVRGSDAVGGTVDARTPSILDNGDRTTALLSGGSFSTVRLKASHAHVFADDASVTGLMAAAGFSHSGGGFRFTDSNGARRDRLHNASTAFEGMLKVESEPLDGHSFQALVEVFRVDREIAGMEQFPSTTALGDDTRVVAGVGWRGPRLFGRRGATSAVLYGRFLAFGYRDSDPNMGAPQDTMMMSGGFGARFSTLAAPWKRFAFRFGADGGYDRGSVRRAGQSDYWPSRGTLAGIVGFVAGEPEDNWQVAFDLRLEYDSGFGFRPVPSLGIWYEPHSLVRLTANVGRSFRLPTFEELYFDSGFVQGNPDLEPEDSLAWDFGIEAGRGSWWNLKASYFENYGFNMITFAPVSAFVIRASNSGRAVIRGVETSAAVEYRWFRASVAYTWLDATVSSTGMWLPARPEHTVIGELAFSGGPFKLLLQPSWQSGFYLDAFESVMEEDRFRLDVRLLVKPIPSLTLSLDFMNVTNKTDAVDFLQQPLPGFSAFGTVRIDI